MRGASLRSVAELLGHQSMKMTCAMRTYRRPSSRPKSPCSILPLHSAVRPGKGQEVEQEMGKATFRTVARLRKRQIVLLEMWLLGLDSNQQPSGELV
jgi:hypothetical protein